jgi:uncharacterized protein (DUF1778 family)
MKHIIFARGVCAKIKGLLSRPLIQIVPQLFALYDKIPYICKNNIMESQLKNKDERIEIRISSYDKQIFRKAQKLSGDKSFSSFITRIVKEQSEEIIIKKDKIIASERDRKKFFDAVFGNIKPNQNLVEAAKKYKSQTTLK